MPSGGDSTSARRPGRGGEFRGLHLHGLAISGAWDRGRVVDCVARNMTGTEIVQPIRVNGTDGEVRLRPAKEVRLV